MTTEYSTYAGYETRYTGSTTSQSESYVSVEIPFPKTESKKLTKFKLCFVFVSPFLLIGIIMVLNLSVKGQAEQCQERHQFREFPHNHDAKKYKSTTEAESTTEANSTTEAKSTTEANSTTEAKSTTEANSTTEISEVANRVEILLGEILKDFKGL